MRNIAFVYAGRGASARCVRGLEKSLQALLGRFALVCRRIDARTIRQGTWRHQAAMLCLPGGRDLPYTWDLDDAALAVIRRFVADGGLYVGSCAGAYFAARKLSFRAARVPPVEGRRALGLLTALASGPSQAADAFAYDEGLAAGERSLSLAATPLLRERIARQWHVFNQGGCHFRPLGGGGWRRHEHVWLVASADGQDLAPGAAGQAVAVQAAYGRGRVLLVGAHPELTEQLAAQRLSDVPCRGPEAMAVLVAQGLGGSRAWPRYLR